METLSSPPTAFGNDAKLKGQGPHTPPYTPHRSKRPIDLDDSPASARSIHPTETESPASKAARDLSTEQVQDEVVFESKKH